MNRHGKGRLFFGLLLALLAACGHSGDEEAGPESAGSPAGGQKTADVKTETAASHFARGMAAPEEIGKAVRLDRGSVAAAGKAWRKCLACHTFSSANRVGPGLAGVFGRRAGAVAGFQYRFTRYIHGQAWVWDEAHLRAWMCNSRKAVQEFTGDAHAKTKMPPQHVCDPAAQESVLSKLRSIS